MFGARTEKVARELAIENGLRYGLTVHAAPTPWLVGTFDELINAGVPLGGTDPNEGGDA